MNTCFKRPIDGIVRPTRIFSSLFLVATFTLLIILGGCSESNEQATLNLLSTVPADAEIVGVLNMNTLVTQTGGTVKDEQIVNANKLKEACEQMYNSMGNWNLKYHEFLFAPDSGLECSSMVFFTYKGKEYASGIIYDEKKLIQSIDKIVPGEWLTEGKMKYKQNFVLREDRFWGCPEGAQATVETFSNLSEVESFRNNSYAPTISAAPDAFSVWGSIDGLLKVANMTFSQQTTTRMALGMFFNSPKSIAGACNVDNETVKATIRILDADSKPAKCELAISKIDTKLVADLGGNANCVVAVAISQKLVKQIMDLASSFGGEMPQTYASALEPLDGTAVFASTLGPQWVKDFTGLGFKGAIQTSGKNNARLLQILEQGVGKVQIEGNTFLFGNEGYGTGVAPLADVAKDFNGAWLGVAGAMNFSDRPPYYYFASTLTPAENSLTLNFKMNLK